MDALRASIESMRDVLVRDAGGALVGRATATCEPAMGKPGEAHPAS